MRARAPLTLVRIVERMARLSAPRHHDLARGMAAELASITDPTERRRFALGAIAAILRLALGRLRSGSTRASDQVHRMLQPTVDAHPGGPFMPKPGPQQLLRRHVLPLALSAGLLTLILLATYATRVVPQLSARGAGPGTIGEALLLAVPFIVAMTIPMAVFLAVTWVFLRLGAEGKLADLQRERGGSRRVIVPVLGAAIGVAALTLVSNTQLLPRANARLAAVISGRAQPGGSDRTMTVGQLREAARAARAASTPQALRAAVGYEVEIQKKYALAMACVVLALTGAALGLRFPRGGMGLGIAASGVVFIGYYACLMAGETLADRQVVSPFVAMWMANVLLLGVAVLLLWGRMPWGARGPEGRTFLRAGLR